jgi:tetratricopeptide (TPR) repeat protein
MSVLIEGDSVLVRNSTLEERYPGGVEGYRRDCPNNTFCSDERLSRVGFMMPGDAEEFIAQLAAKGLTPFRHEASEDVALVNPGAGLRRPCSWVEVGRWGAVAIAWLAGGERGDLHAPAWWSAENAMQHLSAEETKERLEFVRSDGAVDVYRDKATGQELYVGRTSRGYDKVRHNELYREACRLIDGLIILDNKPSEPLDEPGRKRLGQAIGLFEEVARINPGNWAAMWLLGKIHQRLEQYERGLEWFARAHRLKPDQPDVAREASIAAMDLGRPEEAIEFCRRAIESKPGDPGLRANLALALLFSGKPDEAQTVAREALQAKPDDQITASIVRIIEEVLSGARPRPHHVNDLG